MPIDIYYCDERADRRALLDQALAPTGARALGGPAGLPAEASAVVWGVEDLARALPAIEALAAARPTLHVVALADSCPPEMLLTAMRAGVRDVATSPEAAREAVARVRRRLGGGDRRPGRTIAVFALKGGVGKSTISANLGIALHRRSGAPTTLIDLSLPCGNLDMYLDVQAPLGVTELLGAGNDVDRAVVRRAMAKHASGVSLLAGHRPGVGEPNCGRTARPLLDVLAESRGLTVVDVGAFVDEAQASALEAADLVIVPVAPLISSVVAMPAIRESLASLGVPAGKVVTVMNHLAADCGPLPAQVVRELLGGAPTHALPYGGPALMRALNEGRPPSHHARRDAFAKAIDVLAEDVLTRVDLPPLTEATLVVRLRDLARKPHRLWELLGRKEAVHVPA